MRLRLNHNSLMACAYKSLKIVRQLYEQQNSQWINASSEQKHFIIFPNMFSFEKNNHLETIRTSFYWSAVAAKVNEWKDRKQTNSVAHTC